VFKEKVGILITHENRFLYEAIVEINGNKTEHEFKNPVKEVYSYIDILITLSF
jgi:hypothetical protein